MRHRGRTARWAVAVVLAALLPACSTSGTPTASTGALSTSPATASGSASGPTADSTADPTGDTSSDPTSDPADPADPADPSDSVTPPTSATEPPPTELQPTAGQLTRDGMWWGVDSTEPMSDAALANVRGWYVGHPTPLVWGRYLTGSFRLRPGEIAFARAHHIALYLIVPDEDCSVCGGGGADLCGNDRTAGQARADAAEAIRAARRYRLPDGVVLYKDIEQIGSCYGELTGRYLVAWYRYVRANSAFGAGFYGNTTQQSWDFPRAYCRAVQLDPRLVDQAPLAQNEPEPQIGAPQGTIGPRNAPRFGPFVPHCVASDVVRVWQYGESTSGDNVTDVDEIRPGTHGLLAPDGTAT